MNKKEFLFISIGIFLTIIAWIVVDIYHIKKKTSDRELTRPEAMQSYEINKKIIDIIMEKKP